MLIRKAKIADIESIIELQNKYLLVNINQNERAGGFVTTPFTVSQITEAIAFEGLFVAEHQRKIIAYAFAGSWQYFSQWPIFPVMEAMLPNLIFKNQKITTENTFQYGPICIDIAFRGTGLFQQLFAFMQTSMRSQFNIGVTFINKINLRSYQAHTTKLGMQVINEFTFNNNQYYYLAFEC
jgi:hypothetical protein